MARRAAQEDEDLDSLLDEADAELEGDEEAFDLSDIEEAQIGALAKGDYLCKVVDVKLTKVKTGENAGAKQFAIRFRPVSPASNKLVFKHAGLAGKSAPYTKGLLKNLGVDTSSPVRPSTILTDEEGNERYIWLTLDVRKDRPGDNEIVATRPFDGNFPDGADDDVEDAV